VGTHRFRIKRLYSDKPYQEADVEWLAEPAGDIAAAGRLAEEVLEKVESVGGQVDWDSPSTHDPIAVSHVVASRLPFDLSTKQRLLEAEDAERRLEAESEILDVAF
jgi:Lon protease-like protein